MDLIDIKQRMHESGILISFSGSFSHGIIEELGTAVKKYLESAADKPSAMMDVFSVYIEAAQNVRNYSDRRLAQGAGKSEMDANILVIARQNDRYQISAGNAVANADIPALTARLEQLAGMDKAGLKALYKEQLRRERGPEDGGAGLGLIEMARRASEPLRYRFTPIDGGSSYFSLSVVI
ncbi:MAG: SiaB family protein kinase [Proteobacteria bacterium]|nr:SiaB family protein kinase [Pseudomonadota bacterium]MBS0462770.1 SiaB family protein kinase [Pseudomonadota bacterium]MBS0465542.1 SiaB family protein kinase [Pseudomonadota bacterium]